MSRYRTVDKQAKEIRLISQNLDIRFLIKDRNELIDQVLDLLIGFEKRNPHVYIADLKLSRILYPNKIGDLHASISVREELKDEDLEQTLGGKDEQVLKHPTRETDGEDKSS